MSYAVAAALQEAIYGRIANDAGVQALVGNAVYDAPPAGTLPSTWVLVGEEDVRGRSDATAAGALHDLVISVFSDAAGFATAKAVAVAISDALAGPEPALSRGRIAALDFRRARARRGRSPGARRIDLWYRARVEDA